VVDCYMDRLIRGRSSRFGYHNRCLSAVWEQFAGVMVTGFSNYAGLVQLWSDLA